MHSPEQLHDDARRLRHNQTESEHRLWTRLRAKRLDGAKFRRQHPIGNYIVDFCCLGSRLIVEVDGGQHDDQIERDERRSAWLAAQGFRVIRFWNDDVLKSMDSVLQKILEVLEEISSDRKIVENAARKDGIQS